VSGRRLTALAGLAIAAAALALLSGCYASTEPATEVGPDSAKLNARGTANNGPARSYFEFELSGRVGDPQFTLFQQWPAGASGPFSTTVGQLAANSTYDFRVCGADEGQGSVCAQTRSFTTKPAVEDGVFGTYAFSCCSHVSVNARSGPSGEHPQGRMTWARSGGFDPASYSYTGLVTCLEADGSSAVVASLGQLRVRTPGQPDTESLGSMVMTVEDGHQEADTVGWLNPSSVSESFPCDPDYVDFAGEIPATYEFVVNDAEPAAPTAR
jgi:hypothetical protein